MNYQDINVLSLLGSIHHSLTCEDMMGQGHAPAAPLAARGHIDDRLLAAAVRQRHRGQLGRNFATNTRGKSAI